MASEPANRNRSVWAWLKDEKEAISSISTLLQSIAVIVGVVFAVNEFVLKDRDAELMRVTNSFEIFRGESGFGLKTNLGDFWMNFIGVTDNEKISKIALTNADALDIGTETAIRRYTEIQTCLKTHTCNEEVIQHLFCSEAFFDSFVAYKILIKPPGWERANYDERLDNLFDFTLYCMESKNRLGSNEQWANRRSEKWDPVLGELFRGLDERWQAVEAKSKEAN